LGRAIREVDAFAAEDVDLCSQVGGVGEVELRTRPAVGGSQDSTTWPPTDNAAVPITCGGSS
jgi:hypothetical protein